MNRFIKKPDLIEEIKPEQGELKVDQVKPEEPKVDQVKPPEQERIDPVQKDEVRWIRKNFTIEGSIEKVTKSKVIERKILGGFEYSDPLFDSIRQCVNSDPRCVIENIKIKQPNGGTQLLVIGNNFNDKYCSIDAVIPVNDKDTKIRHIVKFFKDKFKRIVETNENTKEYFI